MGIAFRQIVQSLRQSLTRSRRSKQTRPASRKRPGTRLVLESLEDRLAPATFHVALDPLGNDANAGTAVAPFRTIQHAIDVVATTADGMDDEIRVQAGTYSSLAMGDLAISIPADPDISNLRLSGGWNVGFTAQTGGPTVYVPQQPGSIVTADVDVFDDSVTIQGIGFIFDGLGGPGGTRNSAGIISRGTGLMLTGNNIEVGSSTAGNFDAYGVQTLFNSNQTGLTISGNTFLADAANASGGIYLNPGTGTGIVVSGNTITGSTLSQGIAVDSISNVSVVANAVTRLPGLADALFQQLIFAGPFTAPAATTQTNIRIAQNALDGGNITNSVGIEIGNSSGNGFTITGVTIEQNRIQNNRLGIFVNLEVDPNVAGAPVVISSNFIVGNVAGLVRVQDPALPTRLVNAGCNWWGDRSGPMIASNPTGTGQPIAGLDLASMVVPDTQVDYSPWLLTGTDTVPDAIINPASLGFQGDVSQLGVSAGSPQAAGAVGNIQEAINKVPPGGGPPIPKILLTPGTYLESVLIDRTLTLCGPTICDPNKEVIIDPPAGDGITITANNVTIQDVRVTTAVNGIRADGVSGLNLTDVQLDANTANGLNLTNMLGTITLSDLVILSNGAGGTVTGSGMTVLDFTTSSCVPMTDDTVTVTATTLQHTRVNPGPQINQAITYMNLGRLNIRTLANNGATGRDIINLQATAAMTVYEVFAGDGSDTINIGSSNSLDGIIGPVTVNGENNQLVPSVIQTVTCSGLMVSNTLPEGDILNFNDQGDTDVNNYVLTATTFQRTLPLPATGLVTYGTVETVNLRAGMNTDTINVLSTTASVNTNIDTSASVSPPANAVTGDTIRVTTTGMTSNVVITGDALVNAITITNTGDSSILIVDAAAGDDMLTLAGSGFGSGVRLNGGANNDTITIGTGTLDTIGGLVCVDGGGESPGPSLPLTVCGTTRALPRGDSVRFNDSADPSLNSYVLSENALDRNGIVIGYAMIETVQLDAGTGSDDISVAGTVAGGSTVVNAGGTGGMLRVGGAMNLHDAIGVATTGLGSNVTINGGDEASPLGDFILVSNTGLDSYVQLNGQAGRDTITVAATGTSGAPGSGTSRTEANGGANDDFITIGAGTLDVVRGTVCVNGDGHDPDLSPPLSVCGVARALVLGDTVRFNDSADSDANAYVFSDTALVRNGVAINYLTTETVQLDAGTGSDDITVISTVAGGTTTVNAGNGTTGHLVLPNVNDSIGVATTGTGSNMIINGGDEPGGTAAMPLGDFILVSNTGLDSWVQLNGQAGRDTITVVATGTSGAAGSGTSRTEVNGGANDDFITIGGGSLPMSGGGTLDNIRGTVCVNGDGHDPDLGLPLSICGTSRLLVLGDTLRFEDSADPDPNGYVLSDTALTRNGVAITYTTVESVQLRAGLGSDDITVLTTVAGGTTTIDTGPGIAGRPGLPNVNDAVGVATTGTGSNVIINGDPVGGVGDLFLVSNTGLDSWVQLNGQGGPDTIAVAATGASGAPGSGTSRTEVNGGARNDFITIGAGTLDVIRGAVCVNGNDHDPDLGPPVSVCGTSRQLVLGDTVRFNDSADLDANSYALSDNNFTRGSVAIIYTTTETVQLDAGTGSDNISVVSTVMGGSTTINAGNGTAGRPGDPLIPNVNDSIGVTTTGMGSNVIINGGDEAPPLGDLILVSNTGSGSWVQFNGQAGRDTITVAATGGDRAEVNGGNDNDFITMGTGRLGPIDGIVCVNGNDHDPDLGPPLSVCGTARALVLGDTLRFDDSAAPGTNSYVLTDATLASSFSDISYATIETVQLDASTGSDNFSVVSTVPGGSTTINAGNGTVGRPLDPVLPNINDAIGVQTTGPGSNLTINGGNESPPLGDLVLVSNTGMNSFVQLNGQNGADIINLYATNATGRTEANGGADNDAINVGSTANMLDGIQGAVCVNGDGNLTNPTTTLTVTTASGVSRTQSNTLFTGDTLNLNDQGSTVPRIYSLTSNAFQRTGTAVVQYMTVETVRLNAGQGFDRIDVQGTAPSVNTFINTTAGGDTVNLFGTGASSNVVVTGDTGRNIIQVSTTGTGGVTQINGGDEVGPGDTITVFTTGSNSALQVNGGAGNEQITLRTNGANSLVRLDGNAGRDQIHAMTTSLGSRTDINGGTNNDTVNVGSTLDGILGPITIDGGAHDTDIMSKISIPLCGISVDIGDTVNFNDQNDLNSNLYTVGRSTLNRTGAALMSYVNVETVNVMAGLGSDTFNITFGILARTTLISGAGNDRFMFQNGAGLMGGMINGGTGIDLLDYAAFLTPIFVDLLMATATGTCGVMGIDNITGGQASDMITGNDLANVISGLSGDDFLSGLGGNDTLLGSFGNDTQLGGEGDDLLATGLGGVTVFGGNGFDTVLLVSCSQLLQRGNTIDLGLLSTGFGVVTLGSPL